MIALTGKATLHAYNVLVKEGVIQDPKKVYLDPAPYFNQTRDNSWEPTETPAQPSPTLFFQPPISVEEIESKKLLRTFKEQLESARADAFPTYPKLEAHCTCGQCGSLPLQVIEIDIDPRLLASQLLMLNMMRDPIVRAEDILNLMTAMPIIQAPEAPASEVTAPEAPASEVTAPEAPASEVTAPEAPVSEVTALEAPASEVTAPEVTAPPRQRGGWCSCSIV